MDDLSKRLRLARVRAGFASARSAAIEFEWPMSSYGAHENGRAFNATIATRYAKAFGTSAAWLLTGEGKAPAERRQVARPSRDRGPEEKRLPGRPVRGKTDVGRGKLVEAAREILRRSTSSQLSRKAVSDEAGVTPALVSYYFASMRDLEIAATAPLINERVPELLAIVSASDSLEVRLRRIVELLIEVHLQEQHLVDHAFASSRRAAPAGHQARLLETAFERLRQLALQGAETGEWRHVDPEQLLIAIWGMCRAVGLQDFHRKRIGKSARQYADTVIDLVLNGLLP